VTASVPHLDRLSALVAQGPTPLFATVSGAHLYGFESPDSDVDLRGAFVLPLEARLSLRAPVRTHQAMWERDGLELDWVAHDVRKFVRLMTKRNGYVLEQLYSPLVVLGGPWHDELRALGRGCVIRHLYHHYRGFLATQVKLLGKQVPTAKAMLYAYRVVLTGTWVLRTGHIQAHLPTLLEELPQPGVDDLIHRKRHGAEKQALPAGELERHLARIRVLEGELERAFERTDLPEEVGNFDALCDFVVRACRELGGG